MSGNHTYVRHLSGRLWETCNIEKRRWSYSALQLFSAFCVQGSNFSMFLSWEERGHDLFSLFFIKLATRRIAVIDLVVICLTLGVIWLARYFDVLACDWSSVAGTLPGLHIEFLFWSGRRQFRPQSLSIFLTDLYEWKYYSEEAEVIFKYQVSYKIKSMCFNSNN